MPASAASATGRFSRGNPAPGRGAGQCFAPPPEAFRRECRPDAKTLRCGTAVNYCESAASITKENSWKNIRIAVKFCEFDMRTGLRYAIHNNYFNMLFV
jgi:hypothetical protein